MQLTKGKLAIILSKLKVFESPKAESEQYAIPSQIAATLLWDMYMNGDIDGKTVADFGCGTGILGLGTSLLGAKNVFLIDFDQDALDIAKENKKYLEDEFDVELNVVFEHKDITEFNKKVDVAIQNPPFGVQKEHADKEFLQKAFSITDKVYSMHKAESEKFLSAFARDNGFKITNNWLFDWPLKSTMKHHTQKKHTFKVGAWRFEKE